MEQNKSVHCILINCSQFNMPSESPPLFSLIQVRLDNNAVRLVLDTCLNCV